MASNRKRLKMDDEIGSSSSIAKEVTLEANLNSFTSDFGEIVTTNCFVDKTLLIKTIFNNSEKGILITAPRRFGKSTNMDMVKKFVQIQVDDNGVAVDKETSPNRNIFKDNNLLIFQDKVTFNKNFATYPVIHASFKPVTGKSFDRVLDTFRLVLHQAFKQHEYLLTSDKLASDTKEVFITFSNHKLYRKLTQTDIEAGLQFLSECLYKHFDKKKVFVLIDEYDAPINNTMFEDNSNIEQVNKLLCMIFSNTLKENQFVDRALLTGISYFATVGFSAVNNIEKYMFLDKHVFVPYYGLEEEEVDKLFSKFQIDKGIQEKAKKHYNGYFSLNSTKLFSIWSVLKFLLKREVENYWEQSGLMVNLLEAMNCPVIRCSIETLCLEKSVNITIFKKIEMDKIKELQEICSQEAGFEAVEIISPDIYLNFLLQQGYLTFEKHVPGQLLPTVRIPNAEILVELRTKLFNHYRKSLSACVNNCAISFQNIFTSSKDETFKDFISKFNDLLDELKNKFVKRNEDTYHCIMFSVLCWYTKVVCGTEYTIPGGRIDLIVCKDDVGIIIELKYNKSSMEALEQIKTKYSHGFDSFQNVKKRIHIGLNVSEHNVANISVLEDSTVLEDARHFSI